MSAADLLRFAGRVADAGHTVNSSAVVFLRDASTFKRVSAVPIFI
jgi:hypothetical protein